MQHNTTQRNAVRGPAQHELALRTALRINLHTTPPYPSLPANPQPSTTLCSHASSPRMSPDTYGKMPLATCPTRSVWTTSRPILLPLSHTCKSVMRDTRNWYVFLSTSLVTIAVPFYPFPFFKIHLASSLIYCTRSMNSSSLLHLFILFICSSLRSALYMRTLFLFLWVFSLSSLMDYCEQSSVSPENVMNT